jgi:arginase
VDRTLTAPTVVVGLLCRTSDLSPNGARGARALAEALGARLGVEPRIVGTPGEADGLRDYEDDLRDSRGCLLEAGGQVDDAIAAGEVPVLVAGHCPVCMATLPAVIARRPEARILWLDAHADFNTPETTPSRFLGGMCLAAACGQWDSGFEGDVPTEQVVLAGVRDLDEGEQRLVGRSGVRVVGSSTATAARAVAALEGAPVFIHLDLDVLDESIVPAEFPAPGGLTLAALADVLAGVGASSEVLGIEITCFPAPDAVPDGDALAAAISDAVAGLLEKGTHAA